MTPQNLNVFQKIWKSNNKSNPKFTERNNKTENKNK